MGNRSGREDGMDKCEERLAPLRVRPTELKIGLDKTITKGYTAENFDARA